MQNNKRAQVEGAIPVFPNGQFAHDNSDAVTTILFKFRITNAYSGVKKEEEVTIFTNKMMYNNTPENVVNHWENIMEAVHRNLKTRGWRDKFEIFRPILSHIELTLARAAEKGVLPDINDYQTQTVVFLPEDVVAAFNDHVLNESIDTNEDDPDHIDYQPPVVAKKAKGHKSPMRSESLKNQLLINLGIVVSYSNKHVILP